MVGVAKTIRYRAFQNRQLTIFDRKQHYAGDKRELLLEACCWLTSGMPNALIDLYSCIIGG